jgi:DNA-binding MarR family transcriptional regulator
MIVTTNMQERRIHMPEIKDLIKQTKFESSFQKAQINLIYTFNDYYEKTNQIFKRHGLLSQHFNVLKIVKGKHPDPVNPSYILDVMLDKGRDLTRLVDKLVEMQLLERSVCYDNKRKKNLSITQNGLDLVKKLETELKDWSQNNNKLSVDEAEQLSLLLDKFRG